MGINTGCNLAQLPDVAVKVAALPGAQSGGRTRAALRSQSYAERTLEGR